MAGSEGASLEALIVRWVEAIIDDCQHQQGKVIDCCSLWFFDNKRGFRQQGIFERQGSEAWPHELPSHRQLTVATLPTPAIPNFLWPWTCGGGQRRYNEAVAFYTSARSVPLVHDSFQAVHP